MKSVDIPDETWRQLMTRKMEVGGSLGGWIAEAVKLAEAVAWGAGDPEPEPSTQGAGPSMPRPRAAPRGRKEKVAASAASTRVAPGELGEIVKATAFCTECGAYPGQNHVRTCSALRPKED